VAFVFLVLLADFYSCNRVKIRYCDGSSFTGDVEAVEQVSYRYGPVRSTWQKNKKKSNIDNMFAI
jgi:hypothetical protein